MTEPALVLASASPRRQELLAALGLPFAVSATDVPEPLDPHLPAAEQACALALAKARAAARHRAALTLGADTIVVLDGRPLGKPADAAEARRMLTALQGRTHRVITGLAAVRSGRRQTVYAETAVVMRPYTDAEITAYIAGGDPFDKAGAYAIQHPGFAPVERIAGCYCNVMGLPLWTARALLLDMAPELEPAQPSDTLSRCAACPLRGG